jgi:hypothetical protein
MSSSSSSFSSGWGNTVRTSSYVTNPCSAALVSRYSYLVLRTTECSWASSVSSASSWPSCHLQLY